MVSLQDRKRKVGCSAEVIFIKENDIENEIKFVFFGVILKVLFRKNVNVFIAGNLFVFFYIDFFNDGKIVEFFELVKQIIGELSECFVRRGGDYEEIDSLFFVFEFRNEINEEANHESFA